MYIRNSGNSYTRTLIYIYIKVEKCGNLTEHDTATTFFDVRGNRCERRNIPLIERV